MDRAREVILTLPREGEVLLVVPPFTSVAQPLLAPHLLQAIGREAGFRVGVLHAHLILAEAMGFALYDALCNASNRTLLGERVFAGPAYGHPPLGHRVDALRAGFPELVERFGAEIDWAAYQATATRAVEWTEAVAREIADLAYPVVGCTTMFEQTSAAVALLRRVKQRRPDVVTLLGGANCEGPMARGVAALAPEIDYIFSGESDATFPAFLRELARGRRPAARIIQGELTADLDALPTPSYVDYFRQIERLLPPNPDNAAIRREIRVPLESSRGCWWGQKHHCTFCGLNGLGMAFREKSAERTLRQLEELAGEYPRAALGSERVRVSMTDNIMPRGYFRTLVPELARRAERLHVFYEQKSNLTFDDVLALKAAGIEAIQPGIESLSTSYLKRMQKGVTASQNLALLRYGVSAELAVTWNLLTHFPGDTLDELDQLLALVPLLHHLPPPEGPCPLSIDRFSPYFDRPSAHDVTHVRPLAEYAEVFPAGVPLDDLAYFFEADYACASRDHPERIDRLGQELRCWRASWRRRSGVRPLLAVRRASGVWSRASGATLVLVDTRGLAGAPAFRPLDDEQARLLLVRSRPDDGPVRSALEQGLLVLLDGWAVPLATAEPDLLRRFEGARQERVGSVPAISAPTTAAVSQTSPRISL